LGQMLGQALGQRVGVGIGASVGASVGQASTQAVGAEVNTGVWTMVGLQTGAADSAGCRISSPSTWVYWHGQLSVDVSGGKLLGVKKGWGLAVHGKRLGLLQMKKQKFMFDRRSSLTWVLGGESKCRWEQTLS